MKYRKKSNKKQLKNVKNNLPFNEYNYLKKTLNKLNQIKKVDTQKIKKILPTNNKNLE